MNSHEITILPPSIYNKISAGEVIERPASIVKELIENALDADADSIKISVYGGGIKKIQVTDNGKGILQEDIKNAFCPHATSKINNEDDLFNIKTLGFRGEALASIAAVSKVTLISKRKDEKAFSINIADGVYSDIIECAGNNGTTVITEDLFYNTPARLKFLKKTSSEIAEISDIVLRMIISNPNVAFRYSNENKIIYQSPGKGVESAINATYGTENLQKCIKINAIYRQYSIKGYISHPNYPKNNTTEQTIIINGRYIKNTTISSAVKVAYKPYLMTRQYPFYVLYLSIPIMETDVNVHPINWILDLLIQRLFFLLFMQL
jgi:DNA mismatch repair protein MutL